ncbi:hypothetical protein D9613_012854 [Agrocybe pediades]|uniref:ABC transporter domain-containing protein n=1 Tax=Agrocybe pediades TaxID=84607 RepID=A0A8H4QV19_9AGAR|nr:hypothetical protein D9613_012854 [Agrocybe pediades]
MSDFMGSVFTNIMDLTHKKKLIYYAGNYSTYVKTKQENEVNQMKAYHKQQDEIAHIKKFIASAGTYANLVRQAKSKQKIIDKMEAAGLGEKVETGKQLRFNFEDVRKLDMDSRIAILGANGTGKSSLLHLITGALQPCEGTISNHLVCCGGVCSTNARILENSMLMPPLPPVDQIEQSFLRPPHLYVLMPRSSVSSIYTIYSTDSIKSSVNLTYTTLLTNTYTCKERLLDMTPQSLKAHLPTARSPGFNSGFNAQFPQ